MQPGLDAPAYEEHGGCRAVVGAAAGVLRESPAELREHQHQHPLALTGLIQIICRF